MDNLHLIRRLVRHGTLPQLAAFEAVVRLGSFTRAAERLHMAQPTVSGHVRKLADAVGLPLLELRDRRVVPTPAGQALLDAARDIFAALHRADTALDAARRGGPQGGSQDHMPHAPLCTPAAVHAILPAPDPADTRTACAARAAHPIARHAGLGLNHLTCGRDVGPRCRGSGASPRPSTTAAHQPPAPDAGSTARAGTEPTRASRLTVRMASTALIGLGAVSALGALPAAATERALNKEVVVAASAEQVWAAWTTRDGIRSFMAPDADIDARVGGAFHIHFDPLAEPGSKGADDMRYMALQPLKMLSLDWNAPPHLAETRTQRTFVEVRLEPVDAAHTRVRLHHTGWGDGS